MGRFLVFLVRHAAGVASVSDAALRSAAKPHRQRRRAVLVITDNVGVRTRREQSVVEEFWEFDAVLSALIVPNRPSLLASSGPPSLFKRNIRTLPNCIYDGNIVE